MCLQYQVVFEASKLPLQRAAKGGGKCMTDASPDEAGPAQAPLLDRGATYSAGRNLCSAAQSDRSRKTL